jgi:hypothetical protein
MNNIKKNEIKYFNKTMVVSRDFVKDWFQRLRSLFGMRLIAYEQRIDTSINKLKDEVFLEKEIAWYRINQDVIGDSIIITIYGEYK